MLRIVVGIFFVLHGLVHMLYFGQSQRLFELQPGMVWPEGSWAFSNLFGAEGTRLLASIACLLAAAGFLAGGIGIFASHASWRPIVVVAAAFSAALFILFWDAGLQGMDNKGGVGLLINVAILVAVLVLQ